MKNLAMVVVCVFLMFWFVADLAAFEIAGGVTTGITQLKTYVAGEPATAADVNQNFALVRDAVNDDDARLDAIQAGGVTSAYITDGTIATADIANGAVTGAKIGSATITASNIADGAITSAKIADATIATADIADSAVTSAKILNSTIIADDIANSTITAAKIGTGAVTTSQILDATIATADIADNAVTAAKIADGNILTADLADSAVTSAKILDSTIATADIANSAVTAAKTLDEAGAEWYIGGTTRSISGLDNTTIYNMSSLSVTAPAAGYVVVVFSGYAVFFGEGRTIQVGIGTSTTAFISGATVDLGRLDGSGTLRFETPYTVMAVASVAAGTTYYYSLCQGNTVFDKVSVNVVPGQMVAFFIPTRY